MNWYRESKKKSVMDEFSYGEEIRTLWNKLLNKEQDRVNISFDLENNDGYEIKTKELKYKNKKSDDQFRIKAQICWAAGDWQSPVCYFRCQYEDRMYFERDKNWGRWSERIKTIIIPEKNNANLIKGKKGLTAKSAEDGDSASDTNQKALWDEMVEIAEKRLAEYYKEYFEQEDGGDYGFDNTGCVRKLTDNID
jgi:hypothetical protein